MRGKKLWIVVVLLVALAIVTVLIQSRNRETAKPAETSVNKSLSQAPSNSTTIDPMNTPSRNVPSHYEVPPAAADLRPVLPASQFMGKAREAYEAVKQIPLTIAQMPCYCHCDRGMGHKSLQGQARSNGQMNEY